MRLYEVFAEANDLPMDQSSRYARAKAMGFDTSRVLYRGTDTDETHAGRNSREGRVSLAPDPKTASHYAAMRKSNLPHAAPNVMPVFIRHDAKHRSPITGAERSAIQDWGDEVEVRDPASIRSIFARFDPSRRDSTNLMD
jgi:hypothetical protein